MLSWWEGKVGTEQPEFIVDQNLGLTSQTKISIEQCKAPNFTDSYGCKLLGGFLSLLGNWNLLSDLQLLLVSQDCIEWVLLRRPRNKPAEFGLQGGKARQ